MEQGITPKQQTAEAIRQAESILVVAGQRPTVDQAVAVIALGMILKKLGKRVSTVISDQVPSKVNFLPLGEIEKDLGGLRDFVVRLDLSKAEVDKLRYTIENNKLNLYITPFSGGFTKEGVTFDHGEYNYDLAIVLGVPSRDRVEKAISSRPEFTQKVPLINIDFHRSNENFGAVNLVDAQAASLCEILAGLAESLQVPLDENIATALLTGLYASTDRFTAVHTSAKSLTLSAQLIAAGAKHQQVVKSLFAGQPEPQPKSQTQQAEKNQAELKKLEELKNPEPAPSSRAQRGDLIDEIASSKSPRNDEEPKKQEAEKPQTETKPTPPEVLEEPRVTQNTPEEDQNLDPEARIEFELPDHIKSGLASFLES